VWHFNRVAKKAIRDCMNADHKNTENTQQVTKAVPFIDHLQRGTGNYYN
jgi:hypothetical protein